MPRGSIEDRIDNLLGLGPEDGAEGDAQTQQHNGVDGSADTTTAPHTDPATAPLSGGAAGGANGQQTTTQPPTGGAQPQRQTQQQGNTGQQQPPASGGTGNNAGTQQPAQRTAQAQQPGRGRLPSDAQGNLIDPNSGAIIARAGNERRYFEGLRTAQQELGRTRTELTRVQAQLEAASAQQNLPQQFGVSPQDAVTALQFMAHWRKNPVEAATQMLAELRTMGYNVDGLGGGVDLAAIQRMIRDTAAPYAQDRAAMEQQQQAQAAANRELADATARFPWLNSDEVQTALVNVMEADPQLTLREAALVVQAWAAQNSIDLYQPIVPQIAARQQAQQQQQQGSVPATGQQQQRPNNARTPAPTATGGGAGQVLRTTTPAGHDASTRDIVLEAMREHGLNVQ